jgi:hypothetical protein
VGSSVISYVYSVILEKSVEIQGIFSFHILHPSFISSLISLRAIFPSFSLKSDIKHIFSLQVLEEIRTQICAVLAFYAT